MAINMGIYLEIKKIRDLDTGASGLFCVVEIFDGRLFTMARESP